MEKAKVTLGNETFWFGSVDGEEFLPLNQEPTEEHAEFIRENLEIRNGKMLIRVMKSFLQSQGAKFAPLEEKLSL